MSDSIRNEKGMKMETDWKQHLRCLAIMGRTMKGEHS